jgi:hypothetical protein
VEAQKPLTYIAAEKIYLADSDKPHMVKAGEEFKYAGQPSANMIPTCAEGRKRAEATGAYNKQIRENPAPIDAVPEATSKAAAAAVAKAKARAKKIETGDEELA